jgi:arginyl-tRNA synthetase
LTEEDKNKKYEWIGLLQLTLKVLESGIDLLAFEAPDRM